MLSNWYNDSEKGALNGTDFNAINERRTFGHDIPGS
jgi:hypothetical protein